MKITPQCIQCIVNVRLNEVRKAIRDPVKSIRVQIELLKVIHEEFRRNNELTIIASNIFNWLIKYEEIRDYYVEVKRKAIDDAYKNIEVFREYSRYFSGYEKFRFGVKVSIAGNILDTGVYGHKPPSNVSLDYILSTPLTIDHTWKIYSLIKNGGHSILWLFDNAGEAIYDTILIDILRSYGNKVIGVVKEDPGFQNDLTLSDAEYAKLYSYVDKLVSTGYNGSSIHLDRVSSNFKEVLDNADLVFAKGMAHYEYLSEVEIHKPIIFLLIPKCKPIADSLGVERNTFVAYYRETP